MGILNFIGGLFRRGSTVEPPAIYQPQPVQRPLVYGTHGRLEIRSLFITVPLYDAGTGAEKQKVVDDPNSAVFFHLGMQDVIADHACQANFQNLNMAKPGMTAVIDQKETKTTYRMVQTQVGHIRMTPLGNRLYDQNWNAVGLQNEGGLCIYTCMGQSADDVMDVRLTYWQPVETK